MNIRKYIKKLQALPEGKKKIIFFTVVVISVLILGFFYIQSTVKNLSKIGESFKSVDLPKLDMPQPDINLPDIEINDVVSDLDSPIFNK